MTHSSPLIPEPPADRDRDDYTTALLNALEDARSERTRLEEIQRAALNVFEDFTGEKVHFEETQRAMLNLLEDFAMEREKTEAANRELRVAVDSLRLAKEAVDAANRELEAFAYSVSHDLRAPLRSISGFSRLLLEDDAGRLSDDGRDSLNRIIAAVEKMGRLIDDLLNLSRVTRVDMQRRPVDLSWLAGKLVEELRKSQPDQDVEVIIQADLTAQGDERLLNVALGNLFDNAWKFTRHRPGARIEFGAERREGSSTFYVRDNGTGFEMAYAGKLFQPFQRLHSTRDFPGTGIGLATVKRIIERHGGRVWIEAEPERGATAYFTLGEDPGMKEVP